MIKLVALDMDGTLLNSRHEISSENRELVKTCIEKGVKFVLISGREIESIKHYSRILDLDTYLTGYNGSLITNNDGNKAVFSNTLNPRLVKAVIEEAYKANMFIIAFLQDSILVSDNSSKWYKNFLEFTIANPIVEADLLLYLDENNKWDEINKICLSDDHKKLIDFKEAIEPKLKEEFTLLFSLPFFLEVFNNNVSKGLALEKLAHYYGVNREEILAIGDGENDISMIKFAGLGVAMGNSSQLVRNSADFITLTNDENGVASTLRKFLINIESSTQDPIQGLRDL